MLAAIGPKIIGTHPGSQVSYRTGIVERAHYSIIYKATIKNKNTNNIEMTKENSKIGLYNINIHLKLNQKCSTTLSAYTIHVGYLEPNIKWDIFF